MRHLAIAVALTAVLMGAIPASAEDDPSDCTNADNSLDSSASCITRLQKAIRVIWKVAQNPMYLSVVLDFNVMRTAETEVGHFTLLYASASQLLGHDKDANPDAFESLRGKYSDPAVLDAFYKTNEHDRP